MKKHTIGENIRSFEFLFDLSLAIGQTLDMQLASRQFAAAAEQHPNFNQVGIWIRHDLLEVGQGDDQLCLVVPESEEPTFIPLTNALQGCMATGEHISFDLKAKETKSLAAKNDWKEGQVAFIPMAELGVISIWTSKVGPILQDDEWPALHRIAVSLEASLQGCLKHREATREIEQTNLDQMEFREKDEMYKSLVENLNEGLIITDRNDQIIFVNSRLEQMTGYTLDEIRGKVAYKLFFPDERWPGIRVILATREMGHPEQFELQQVKKDGSKFWSRMNLSAYRDTSGKIRGTVSAVTDISDQKEAAEKVRRSEEKYKSIIENMELGLLEVDNQGKIIHAYDRYCEITGYTAEELKGQSPTELLFTDNSQQDILMQRRKREKGRRGVYEMQVRKKQGDLIWLLISEAPLYDATQNIIGYIGIHLDITERKRMEDALVDARKKAEESSVAKEQFLANMSHEIRTPMNAITGLSHLLSDTQLSDQQMSYLSAIRTSADQLLVIINDILDISKIELGKLTHEVIGIDLRELVESLFASLHYKAKDKGISLEYEIENEISPILLGDPVRLNQILLNLVNNAIKFTQRGSVRLNCSMVKSDKSNNTIEFSVIDTGIGIGKDKLDAIFESFSQADDSITRRFGGTGLGLSISKKLIEIFGGTIDVKSQKGIGTTFSFTIPLGIGTPQDLVKEVEGEVIDERLKGVKVLLAEDHEINVFLVTTILEKWGLQADIAGNGQEAVDMLQSNEYDVVLMDMQMPVMSGVDATLMIRNELKSDVPIIALTANAKHDDNERCLRAGMNDYISKPFNQEELFSKIAVVLHVDGTKEIPNMNPAPTIPVSNDQLYDLSKLREMAGDDEAFIQKMVTMFLKQVPELVDSINSHFKGGEMPGVKASAHKLKPSLDFMGISELHDDIRLIEKYAGENIHVEELRQLIDRLNKISKIACDQMMLELKEV